MQVKLKAKDSWQAYADTIPGFSYEEGYEYRIKVNVIPLPNDQEKYSLIKVVSKKKTSYNPAARFENKVWVLQSMFDNDRSIKLKDSTINVQFNRTPGRINGHGVCNNFSGAFKVEGKTISITEIAYTKMKCVDQGNIVEQIISNLLQGSSTYTISAHILTLVSPKGSNMVFISK